MVEIELKAAPDQPVWLEPGGRKHTSGSQHFHLGKQSHKWRPPTDVYETEDTIIVRVEIGGMKDSDFSITLKDRSLFIQGVRSDRDDRTTFHQMEVRFGDFESYIELHAPVESQDVEAEYKDGFLRLVLRKAKPHKLHIEK